VSFIRVGKAGVGRHVLLRSGRWVDSCTVGAASLMFCYSVMTKLFAGITSVRRLGGAERSDCL